MLTAFPAAFRRRAPLALCAAGVALTALLAWAALDAARVAAHGSLTPAAFVFLCVASGPPLLAFGAALIPAALAVMAPCLLQLSLVLVTAAAGVAAGNSRDLRLAGLAFAGGFLGVYTLAALAIGGLGLALEAWALWLRVAGGVLIVALGLAVLRVLPGRMLSGCRGPRWLVLSGKASLRRPFAAGGAFAVYCVGCCGPYLAGLALLGVGATTPLQGVALVLSFGLLMGALLLLPMLALGRSRALGTLLLRHAQPLAVTASAALIALGAAIALQPIVVWMVINAS